MLGSAAAAQVRLIVWARACEHQVEPDPAEVAERYGAETTVSGLARAACVRAVWQRADQHGNEWDEAAVGQGGRSQSDESATP